MDGSVASTLRFAPGSQTGEPLADINNGYKRDKDDEYAAGRPRMEP